MDQLIRQLLWVASSLLLATIGSYSLYSLVGLLLLQLAKSRPHLRSRLPALAWLLRNRGLLAELILL